MEVKKAIVVTTGVIFNEHQEVLICLRPLGKALGGLWEFPGGKLDKNECPIQCTFELINPLSDELFERFKAAQPAIENE